MSWGYSQFDSLTTILAGTITAAGIVTLAPAPLLAKTPQEIAQLAISVTVQINGQSSTALGSGSGFIIAKQGTTYTVLTCTHVVNNSNFTYTIRTPTGKDYPITRIVLLQKSDSDADLAVVTFTSTESYPVVSLGDSEQAVVGSEIFVFGYPANVRNKNYGTNRNFEFSPGYVTSRLSSHPTGYTLRYNAVTKGGMSGGPVFDKEGRVVGIHGEGDRDYDDVIDDQKTRRLGQVATKTGFNAAIPINTFLTKLSDVGLNRAALSIDTSPANNNSPSTVNSPNNAKHYYVRGLSRFDKGDLTGAIADFTQALQTQANYPEAYFYRALAYFDQKELQKSIADYSKAIELNAGYVDAYYNRALVLSEMGDKPGAIADYTQVIRLDRSFAAAYNNRGLALSDLGDQKQAIDDFNEALQINPSRASTYFNRGLALFRTGNDRAAIEDYTRAIKLSPNYAKAYANRGVTLARMGDKRSAIGDLEQAARLFSAQGMIADAQKAQDMIRQLQR